MAAGSTYTPIASVTASGSSTSQLVMSSIPSIYTDLVLICSYGFSGSGGTGMGMQFNSDSSTNYSSTILEGNGTSATSNRLTSTNYLYFNYNSNTTLTVGTINSIVNIQNYANTTTYKTALVRTNGSQYVHGVVGLWRATPAAINRIDLFSTSGNIASGSTFTLYGIASA